MENMEKNLQPDHDLAAEFKTGDTVQIEGAAEAYVFKGIEKQGGDEVAVVIRALDNQEVRVPAKSVRYVGPASDRVTGSAPEVSPDFGEAHVNSENVKAHIERMKVDAGVEEQKTGYEDPIHKRDVEELEKKEKAS
jgi:hypothetical protein